MTLAQLLNVWNRFWFELRSPLPVSVFRILYGIHILFFGLMIAPDLLVWYLPTGILSIPAYRDWLGSERFSALFWMPQNEWSVYAVFALLMISAVTLTVGFCTRTSNLVLVLMLVSLHNRNLLILNSGDGLLRLMGIYLLFSSAGQALSIDNWIKRRAGKTVPALAPIWAQRLMQLQICLVYMHSFFAKLLGETWFEGTAVYYALQLRDFYRLPIMPLLGQLWMFKMLTWGTLVIELFMFTLVWIRELRYYILAAAVALHLGIELTMNIPQFEILMISSFVLFIDPNHLQRVVDKLRGASSKAPAVIPPDSKSQLSADRLSAS